MTSVWHCYSQETKVVADIYNDRDVHVTAKLAEVHCLEELTRFLNQFPIIFIPYYILHHSYKVNVTSTMVRYPLVSRNGRFALLASKPSNT